MAYLGVSASDFANVFGMAVANFNNPQATSNGEAIINASLEAASAQVLAAIPKDQTDRLEYIEYELIEKDADSGQTTSALSFATTDTDACFFWVFGESEQVVGKPRKSSDNLVTATVAGSGSNVVAFGTSLSLGDRVYASYPVNTIADVPSLHSLVIVLAAAQLMPAKFPDIWDEFRDKYDDAKEVLDQFRTGERTIQELKAVDFLKDVDLQNPNNVGIFLFRENA